MVRHIVLCKFRAPVSEEQRESAVNAVRALGRSIPDVREWSIGKQAFPSKTAYDLAIVSGFQNREALERYRNHPNHLGIKSLLNDIADLAVVDYEYSPEEEA